MWSERQQRHTGNGAELIRHKGKLKGPIKTGEVFCWEPDLEHANTLCIVTRIEEGTGRHAGKRFIHSIDLDYKTETQNDESRFREACCRTRFSRFPTSKPDLSPVPLPPDIAATLKEIANR